MDFYSCWFSLWRWCFSFSYPLSPSRCFQVTEHRALSDRKCFLSFMENENESVSPAVNGIYNSVQLSLSLSCLFGSWSTTRVNFDQPESHGSDLYVQQWLQQWKAGQAASVQAHPSFTQINTNPGQDVRNQIRVQSLREEDDLLIEGKLAPQSIFAPIHVSQNSFNLHLNWKSSYRHWQTFCLNVLFRPQDLNKLYDWTGTMPVMLSSVVHSYSALMTYSHRIWWK